LPGGAVVTVDNGFDFDDTGFELCGDAATVVGRGCYGQLPVGTLDIIQPNRRPVAAPRRIVDAREGELPHYHMYRRELELFCECIRNGRQPENSGRCGLQDLRVIDQLLADSDAGAVRTSDVTASDTGAVRTSDVTADKRR
jgi:predicted dehydrogenase